MLLLLFVSVMCLCLSAQIRPTSGTPGFHMDQMWADTMFHFSCVL